MTDFHVNVVRIDSIEKHPNADTLGIIQVQGYPVIVKLDSFQPGDLAVYIPEGALVPNSEPFAFLGGERRIKARRLRGVFSMGLLIPASEFFGEVHEVNGWIINSLGNVQFHMDDDVASLIGVEKYEKPTSHEVGMADCQSDAEANPLWFPEYTDIEPLRRYPNILEEGEYVVMTEMIHGSNYRACYHEGELVIGSHHKAKSNQASLWWRVAQKYDLETKLAIYPDILIFCEIYGKDPAFGIIQTGYDYGTTEHDLVMFDAMDLRSRTYLDFMDLMSLAYALDVRLPPLLYCGPWHADPSWYAPYAEGPSKVTGAGHIREGFVAKPAVERFDRKIGRVILKYAGEGYLLNKK